MPEKIAQIDQLLTQVFARQKALQEQNNALARRVRALEQTAAKLQQTEKQLKQLRDWKKNTQNVLRRVAAKIDKEIDKHRQAQDKIG